MTLTGTQSTTRRLLGAALSILPAPSPDSSPLNSAGGPAWIRTSYFRLSPLLLLVVGLALLLWPGPAQAQDGEPPPVSNLRCVAKTDQVAFLWDAPRWSGGEPYAYDYDLTLPDGQGGQVRHRGFGVVNKPGAYQLGTEAGISVTAVYETPDLREVSSAEATLTCKIGGARRLTITPNSTTRVYGGTDDLGYTVSGLVDGDATSSVVTGNLARAPGDDAGSYAINLGTLAIAAAHATKYALPSGPTITTYTVTPKAAAYTATGVNKQYDGTTALAGPLNGGFAAGDIVSGDVVTVSGGTYASADVETGIAVSGSSVGGADAGNYSVTFSVSGDITPRTITAISGVQVNARVADGTTAAAFDAASARATGVVASELADFRAGGLRVSGAFPSSSAGSHDVRATYSLQDHGSFKAGNYTLSAGAAGATLRGEILDGKVKLPTPTPTTTTTPAPTPTTTTTPAPTPTTTTTPAPTSTLPPSTPGTCQTGIVQPVAVAVSEVPIVVASTTADYFVLYVRPDLDADLEIPISVTLGQDGTTTLTEQLAALPKAHYRVEKYQVANPADVDGDCIDDITELRDLGTKNPVNHAKAVNIKDGAVAIPDRATFERLSYQGDSVSSDVHLTGLEFVKFYLFNTDRPTVYFMNTETHRIHAHFRAQSLRDPSVWDLANAAMRGDIVYHPNAVAADGSLGVYRFEFQPTVAWPFERIAYANEVLAASMPFLENNLAYHPLSRALPRYRNEKALYDASRVNVLLEEDIFPDVDFISLNPGEGYGYLRVMSPQERPNPRDVVIYETLPNDLPRVAGIITVVPQTPLSHVNLRAVQDDIPNAFIRGALDDSDIDDLIGGHVRYTVTRSGYSLSTATKAQVDAHYGASRPAAAQTPQRDLSVTKITALSDVGFDDWDAFGVKAANVAVLGTLEFPAGTVPDGFAVPFYFYDEFMKNAALAEETLFGKKKWPAEDKFTMAAGTKLSAAVTKMLAHQRFQTDYEIQDEMLGDLRDAIKDAESPQWIIDALTAMHATYPQGQSLRYRSSTNNEDLPGFSGAGLYDSKTQDPDETAEDGIDKSIKAVWASLWNFRAFVERDFHRVDHARTAMGVLVHPNYSDELLNGVAVSFDPFSGREGAFYVNTQVGEDLVTNPDARSVPEEILLLADGNHEVLAYSNQKNPRQPLMTTAQMSRLRAHLKVVHDRFAALYEPAPGEPFAMEIEFKITSDNRLAIKQARPWVFAAGSSGGQDDTPNQEPTVAGAIADATIVNQRGTLSVSLARVFNDADNDALTITASSSDEAVATVSVASDHSTLAVTANGRGAATIAVTANDGNRGTVQDSFTVTVKAAPVVASPLADLTGLEMETTQDVSLSGVFRDADGDALTVTAASSDEAKATASVASDYSRLTLAGVAQGTTTITVTAQDSDGNRASDTFEVEVAKAPEPDSRVPTEDPRPTVARYDANTDGAIDGSEYQQAKNDWLAAKISYAQFLEVVTVYIKSG